MGGWNITRKKRIRRERTAIVSTLSQSSSHGIIGNRHQVNTLKFLYLNCKKSKTKYLGKFRSKKITS
jgi:hypothetical protein